MAAAHSQCAAAVSVRRMRDRLTPLVAAVADGDQIERLVEGEQQGCALFKIGLGMADEQVGGNETGSDKGTGEGSGRPAEDCSRDYASAHSATVLDAVALQTRTRVD